MKLQHPKLSQLQVTTDEFAQWSVSNERHNQPLRKSVNNDSQLS